MENKTNLKIVIGMLVIYCLLLNGLVIWQTYNKIVEHNQNVKLSNSLNNCLK